MGFMGRQNASRCRVLVDLDPEFVVDCIDWRNIGDAITRSEALEILSSNRLNLERRERSITDFKAIVLRVWGKRRADFRNHPEIDEAKKLTLN